MAGLHQLVIDAAVKVPDRPAVVGPDGVLTYARLDRTADALARRLRAGGVGPGDRVVLWADKSAAVVAATQAVLRLGAAYVPADGTLPVGRVAAMARDCAAATVLTTDDHLTAIRRELGPGTPCADLAQAPGPTTGETEETAEAEEAEAVRSGRAARTTSTGPVGTAGEPAGRSAGSVGSAVGPEGHPAGSAGTAPTPDDPPAAPVDTAVRPDDLAYILYTSGSTGTPKGVRVSHRNARAFIDWAVDTLAPVPEDRFSNHAPFTFDLSVLDLYAAFAGGASVHLVPAELAYAPTQLVELLHERGITVWYSVPSALTLMARDGGLLDRPAPTALRAVLFAGEPFPVDQVRALAAWTGARLINLYGPTETNVCTAHEVVPDDLRHDRPLPIGTAVSGDRAWAETADGRHAGPGEEGELLVEGPTVMLGYWGREPHHGPYRTGDLVRQRPDGSFDYLGRRDHMVKVRGHRVEPGEVESVLALHPDVAEAAVVVDGSGMDARLVAFVVPAPGARPGVLALKRHAARRLPRYMLPDAVRTLARLPRTPNGKVDRAALARAAATPVQP
ncbi:AMP-binding protein [Streptomyces albireticuli]|uniref:AMP-binding protein n=1 Tax=Streptomyces albireticuli TaxID=1940 RepID=UPI00369FDFCD